ncbi:MAG: hypothetical protein JNM68_04325 [Dinghuibacter sp.]|nr:hypothetical protein [Dinghuibacter sp.]
MPANLSGRIKAIQKSIKVNQTGVFDSATCLRLLNIGGVTPTGTNLNGLVKQVQKMVEAKADGIPGSETVTKVEGYLRTHLPEAPVGSSLQVSQKSLDMIVGFEVTSPAVYERRYRKPIWPGGASGVTVGIGYDLGYYTAKQVADAFGRYVQAGTLQLLQSVRGLKGVAAQNALGSVSAVDIPYAVAAQVFHESTLPQFAAMVRKIYPGVEKLPPDAQGALLSLVYNRGADIDPKKDRRREMYNIVALVARGDLAGIAAEIRAMKRLWPTVKGLRDRRDKEADLVANASFNILPQDIIAV